MWLFPCCGEEAVGYSLYHRQSAWGGDILQNLCLLTSNSWRFRVLQCWFCLAVGACGRGSLPLFWWREAYHWSFFPWLYFDNLNVLTASRKKKHLYRAVELDFREKEQKCDLLACHLSPSRSLVFLQNGWAQFVKDGCLVSKGLCVKLFLHYTLTHFLYSVCVCRSQTNIFCSVVYSFCVVLVILGPSWSSVVLHCALGMKLYALQDFSVDEYNYSLILGFQHLYPCQEMFLCLILCVSNLKVP